MKDILLWKILTSVEQGADPETLLELLRELADQKLRDRLPFVGVLDPALRHSWPAIRAAALQALAGCTGLPALTRIVAGLDDSFQEVQQAAVHALSTSVHTDPKRFVHALFHPSPFVRSRALDHIPAESIAWYALFLLQDEPCRQQAAACLRKMNAPSDFLGDLLELAVQGQLAPDIIRSVFSGSNARQSVHAAIQNMDAAHAIAGKIFAEAEISQNAVAQCESPAPNLSFLIDFFWNEPRPDENGQAEAVHDPDVFFSALTQIQAGGGEPWEILGAALLHSAARRGGDIPDRVARLCVLTSPRFITLEWISRQTRRDSVAALYAHARRRSKNKDLVKDLAGHEICRRPSGLPDLWVLGGILHLLDGNPLQEVQAWIGLDQIVDAAREDLIQAIPLLCHEDRSAKGQAFLINAITSSDGLDRYRVMAMMVCVVSTSSLATLEFYERLSAAEAGRLSLEMLQVTLRPDLKLTDGKRRLLVQWLDAKFDLDNLEGFLKDFLALEQPHLHLFGRDLFEAYARRTNEQTCTGFIISLPLDILRKTLRIIDHCDGFPYGKEVFLAGQLAGHADEDVRMWARERLPDTPAQPEAPPVWASGRPKRATDLSVEQGEAIASCDEADLAQAMVPCLDRPVRGLTRALARRPDPGKENLPVACALMLSLDPLENVDRELARFGSDAEVFALKVDQRIQKKHCGRGHLPIQANALIHRFEQHCLAFRDEILNSPAGLSGLLAATHGWQSGLLRQAIWSAADHLMGVWRWREPNDYAARCTEELLDILGDSLTTQDGRTAGKILMRIRDASVSLEPLGRLRERVRRRLPEMDEATRKVIMDWIDSSGLVGSASGPAKGKQPDLGGPDTSFVAGLEDIQTLISLCLENNVRLAHAAARRLAELGEEGLDALRGVICQSIPPPCVAQLCEDIDEWPEGSALDRLRRRVTEESISPQGQFHAALALIRRAEQEFIDPALSAPCRDQGGNWFSPDHWQDLEDCGFSEEELAAALALSSQPAAYIPAMEIILTHPEPTQALHQAAVGFLEAGSPRLGDLRLQVAAWLDERGDDTGYPLLAREFLGNMTNENEKFAAGFLSRRTWKSLAWVADAGLAAGPGLVDEKGMVRAVLGTRGQGLSDDSRLQTLALHLLDNARTQGAREEAVMAVKHCVPRQGKLRRLAEIFAWGVVTGRDLAGRAFKVEMQVGDGLGYTILDEDILYVSPLPVFQEVSDGREIVEGLILHELGHHLYHADVEAKAVARQAREENLAGMLNLVEDEHLERRLRSYDQSFGHRFKKLAAHAFQHAHQDRPVERLLEILRFQALPVFSAAPLNVAREAGCVRVDNARTLLKLEHLGSSLTRFVRALRMGLGNRHNDPKVAEALKLFSGKFRDGSARDLLKITRRLRDIFADEAHLLDLLAMEGLLRAGVAEILVQGLGIDDAELQREIQDILNPCKDKSLGSNCRFINIGPGESFDTISTVIHLDCKPERHAVYVQRVGHTIQRMREYFLNLGLVRVPQRLRLSGRRVDRGRIPALVLRNDPRMLIARRIEPRTDLFLGLLVDCSGSMNMGGRIEKAKLFAVLLAEAARGMRNIDVRIFGFTDSVIYDAGNANRCAAHAFEAGGGNNDAAALWHVAQEARKSRRRARLLVMISDGSPTECTTTALRALVSRLQHRMGMACAQVAVRALDEICFPHYVEIQGQDPLAAVRKFGEVIVKLVRMTMHGAR